MIISRVIIVLFITFAASILSYADQSSEAFSVYVEACRHSGYNPAEIATFQATINIVEKNAWNKPLVESIVDKHKKRMENLDMSAKSQEKYAEALKHMRQTLVDSTRTNTQKIFVRNSASLVGLADTRAHISVMPRTYCIALFLYL